MNSSSKKLAYNVGGAIVGALLATVAIFGLINQQSSATQPQKYSQTINYDQ